MGEVPHFQRALGGPFAGSLRSGFQPRPVNLCACAAGLISASTVYHSVARTGAIVNTGRVFSMFSMFSLFSLFGHAEYKIQI